MLRDPGWATAQPSPTRQAPASLVPASPTRRSGTAAMPEQGRQGPEGCLGRPTGVALARDGSAWISDWAWHRILKMTASGEISVVAGGNYGMVDGVGTRAQFAGPLGICFDPEGNALVVDGMNHAIRRVTPAGAVTTIAGNGTRGSADGPASCARFADPTAIATNGSEAFVADSANNAIRKLDLRTGAVSTLAGGGQTGFADGQGATAHFSGPLGLACSGSSLVVSDAGNHAIRLVSASGAVSTLAGGALDGALVDGPGNVARFNVPSDIVAYKGGYLLSDYGNHAVRWVSLDGAVSTVAGGGKAGCSDGAGAAARLTGPQGLAVDERGGRVLLCDGLNHRIRALDGAGMVTTLAGEDTGGFADGRAAGVFVA